MEGRKTPATHNYGESNRERYPEGEVLAVFGDKRLKIYKKHKSGATGYEQQWASFCRIE
jgi:hypothetical protein